MKINHALTVEPNADGTFTWIVSTPGGLCQYYTMPRHEADLVMEVLQTGSKEWWEAELAKVAPYQETEMERYEREAYEVWGTNQAFESNRDHGDENDAAR